LFLLFKFFDAFPQSVYYYMWPDVIPAGLMGMFGAMFRVCYAAGSLVFNKFLIGLAKSHPEEIYLGAALAYMLAFLLLCWQVKEPEYPPPPVDEDVRGGALGRVLRSFGTYFRECFTHPFYLKYYFAMAAFQMGYQPFISTLVYFGTDIFGDNPAGLARYGNVMALKDFVWIGIFLALVPIMAKLHPVYAGVAGYVLMTLAAIGGTFFITGPTTFGVFTVLTFASVGLYLGGTAAIGPRLLPPEKYGQFASAGALVFRLGVAVVGTGAGIVLDKLGSRFIYAWLLTFLVIGTGLMWMVYRDWQRLGGAEAYVPPDPSRPRIRRRGFGVSSP
jgi:maltose/moltooligosaccharide transporter